MSEASDSTNYLTTVNIDRYHHRTPTVVHRSVTLNENSPTRSARPQASIEYEDSNKSKAIDQQFNLRSTKSKRGVAWVEETIHSNGGKESNKWRKDDEDNLVDVLNDDDDIDDSKPTFPQANHSIHRSMILDESPYRARRTNSQEGMKCFIIHGTSPMHFVWDRSTSISTNCGNS